MNIFVSNISYQATDETLVELFAPYGEVVAAKIILNRRNGRSRGYGFVEMAHEDEGKAAIAALSGSIHMDRTLKVEEAKGPGVIAEDTPAE
ncbi:MAG: RNA-binding protein [Bacteroidaceae bacterium]|nr:RNA-binding protein [Bacteroidaceae bacterium]